MKSLSRMVALLASLAKQNGYTQTILEPVRLMRSDVAIPRTPIIYDPSIVIIASGRKRGFVGDRTFVYDANNYLVLSVPLPFECETEASADNPVLGMSVRVEPAAIAELLLEMDDESEPSGDIMSGFSATPLNDGLTDAATRLLECLQNPSDARILGPAIVREICYRVLCGEQADSLKALVTRRSKFAQIAKVLKLIHSDFSSRDLDVEMLAKEAGMSVSAFHANFKVVTSSAPLQYIKNVRLHKARQLMVSTGITANAAATTVGYESPSQFSREFKRMFGRSPAEEAARLRASSA